MPNKDYKSKQLTWYRRSSPCGQEVSTRCNVQVPLHGATACIGPGSLRYRGFTITFTHTHARARTHSVGLLWTSDQPDAETCTW